MVVPRPLEEEDKARWLLGTLSSLSEVSVSLQTHQQKLFFCFVSNSIVKKYDYNSLIQKFSTKYLAYSRHWARYLGSTGKQNR